MNISNSWRKQIQDLSLYFQIWIFTVFTWVIVLGWELGEIICQGDAIAMDFPILKDLLKHSGSWKEMIYRSDWIGGTKLSEITGLPWTYLLFSKLGISQDWTINFSVWFAQTAFSFFGIKILQSIYRTTQQQTLELSFFSIVSLVWIFGFTPALALQISSGHWLMITGTLFSIGGLALFLEWYQEKVTFTSIVIYSGICSFCFNTTLQQPVLYSLTFGLPIAITLIPLLRRSFTSALFVLSIIALSLGFSSELFFTLVHESTQGDGARTIFGHNIVYSYLTGTLNDFISCLTWGFHLIDSHRSRFMDHETNFPMGPLLALLPLLWIKKGQKFVIGLLASFALAWLFSMNFKPVSESLFTLIPFLKAFRVPTRSLLMPSFFLPILAMAGYFSCFKKKVSLQTLVNGKASKDAILIIPFGLSIVFIFMATTEYREVLLWLSCLGFLVDVLFPSEHLIRQKITRFLSVYLIASLAIGSVLSFSERSPIRFSIDKIHSEISRFKSEVSQKGAILDSPLDRTFIDVMQSTFDSNIGKVAEIPTLNGYIFPLRRFSALISELNHMEYSPTTVNFHKGLLQSPMELLQKIYNVKYYITLGDRNTPQAAQVQVESYSNSLGRAWFSTSLSPFTSITELANFLLLEKNSLEGLSRKAPLLTSDPKFEAANLPQSTFIENEKCQTSRIRNVKVALNQQDFEIDIENAAECPLTIATNYIDQMVATGEKPGQRNQTLKIFPTYGALTGIWVPPGVEKIHLQILLQTPPFVTVLGWLLFGGSFVILITMVLTTTFLRSYRTPKSMLSPS